MNETIAVPAIPLADIEHAMAAIEKGENSGLPDQVVANAPTVVNPLKEFVDVDQLKRDIEFNPNDLDNAVSSHASMFVHYANLARLAQRQFEKMKNAFAILESRLDQHHRELMTAEGIKSGKKPTEPQIKAAVMTDPRWWAASNRMTDAQAIYSLARDAKAAFEQRKDMIVQLSVDRRIERQGQLRIMEQSASNQSTQAARAAAVIAAGGSR